MAIKLTKETFESKYVPEPNTGCWLSLGKSPYGPIKIAYRLFKGERAKGMDIMHSCDTPACVNPDHLSLGTRKDNVKEMFDRRRAWQTNRTHCPSGHEYSKENTYILHGGRYCRKCMSAKLKRRRQRKSSRTNPTRTLEEKK